jgi:16S rRNA (uracil1498-N3)-methyltransferase
LKPKALDLAIRTITEIGLTHLVVFVAERSNARNCRLDRWQRLLTAAAKQCGRSEWPTIQWCESPQEALASLPATVQTHFIATPSTPSAPAPTGPSSIWVGPEGGFTEAETQWALQSQFVPVGLGHWTLRADTAATLAAAHISAATWPVDHH